MHFRLKLLVDLLCWRTIESIRYKCIWILKRFTQYSYMYIMNDCVVHEWMMNVASISVSLLCTCVRTHSACIIFELCIVVVINKVWQSSGFCKTFILNIGDFKWALDSHALHALLYWLWPHCTISVAVHPNHGQLVGWSLDGLALNRGVCVCVGWRG